MDTTITQLRFPKPGSREFVRLLDFCQKHEAAARAELPEAMQEVLEHCGWRPLLGLLFRYGGREVVLPSLQRHQRSVIFKRLTPVMGEEAAKWFVGRFGPSRFKIASARQLLHLYRSHVAAALHGLGMSVMEVTALVGCDCRSVYRMMKAAPQ